jgi:hypothetical protein
MKHLYAIFFIHNRGLPFKINRYCSTSDASGFEYRQMLKNPPNVKHIIIHSRQIYNKLNYIQDTGSRLGTGVGAAGAA